MTQLIIDTTGNAIVLPESKKGGYQCYREDLGDEVEMISGRIVREVRGSVWHVSYQYGYFDTETMQKLLTSCEKGRRQAITCSFLQQGSGDALTSSQFFVTDYKRPVFQWSRNEDGEAVPMWADFTVELREVRPSD